MLPSTGEDVSTTTGIVVCRGCCCGSPSKKPDIDHAGRLDRLRRLAVAHPGAASVRTSECLGPCEYADVVVVCPSPAGRRLGGRPVWFGLLDEHGLDQLHDWATAGGPGLVPIPDTLALHRINRPRIPATP